MCRRVVELLDFVVKRDGSDACHSRDASAEHEDDPELTDCMSKTQCDSSAYTPSCNRESDVPEDLKDVCAGNSRNFDQGQRNGFQSGLKRLDRKG